MFVRPLGDFGPLDLQLPDRWSLGAVVGGDGGCCDQTGGDTGDDNCRRAADPGGSGMRPHGIVLLTGPPDAGTRITLTICRRRSARRASDLKIGRDQA